jgi:hypothetical protein
LPSLSAARRELGSRRRTPARAHANGRTSC